VGGLAGNRCRDSHPAVNDLPEADIGTGSDLVQAFSQDNKLNGDPGVFTYIGGLAWVTAVVAAAVALRRAGAPLSVAIWLPYRH
jgi:hypothetical protein